MLTVTEPAQKYLLKLIENKNGCVGVKIGTRSGGTPKAETILSYFKFDEDSEKYELETHNDLNVYVDIASQQFLDEAFIDYVENAMGGELIISAPNSKLPKLGENATLEDKVKYVLYNDVYPVIQSHGGEIELVKITDDNIAILRFGGGCKGCSGVDVTIKGSVETALAQSVPEIKGIRDVTDHTDDSGAYMKSNNGVEQFIP